MKVDKRLLGQIGNIRVYLSLTVGLGLLTAVLIILQAQFVSQIIDTVFLKHTSDGLSWTLLAMLAMLIGRAGLAWASEITAHRAASQVKQNLREALFARLLKLGPAYTRGQRSGELTNLAVEGIETLDAYFSQYLPQLFLTALIPTTILVIVFLTDPLSGLVLLLTAPLLPLFMVLIGKGAEAVNKRQWSQLSQMSAHFLDVLQGLTTLKLFGRSQHQQETIAKISDRFRETTLKVLRVAFLSALVLELGATISTAIIAVEIGLRLLNSQINFQPAFFVLLLTPEFYLPFRMLGSRFHASTAASAATDRIFEILDSKDHLQSTEIYNLQSAICNPLVRFDNVYFAYGQDRPALQGVSFELKPGEKIALVGPSGAGKSTIFQLLLRFIEPDEGTIYLDDGPEAKNGQALALRDIPAKTWREQVGWVPQHPYLFNTSVIENIRLGRPEATLEEVKQAARQAHAHEFITTLPQGYDTVIGERGVRLSGGQAQRLSLARAFLKNAPLLLLDEATSNLDSESEALVLEATTRLMQGRTVLMIAHRPNVTAGFDRVIRLEAGKVIQADASIAGGRA
jgi:ATP-binding cassette, subfamily C, bacterial CydD